MEWQALWIECRRRPTLVLGTSVATQSALHLSAAFALAGMMQHSTPAAKRHLAACIPADNISH